MGEQRAANRIVAWWSSLDLVREFGNVGRTAGVGYGRADRTTSNGSLALGMREPAPARTTPSGPIARPAYAWYVVAVLTLANVSGWVDRQILGVLVGPIKSEYGITDTQMSYLVGLAFALFFALLGLP